MISCRFLIPSEDLSDINLFFEDFEFGAVSFFENASLGFSERVDENGFPVANFFDAEVLVKDENEAAELEKELKKKFENKIEKFSTNELKNEDWVELYIKELKPIICDKFYFYNDTFQSMPDDPNLIPIKLNSALAFGSGHHQTTQSCILNARCLNDHGFIPKNILDMGCGTGILGICALKIWPNAKLLGIDIEEDAVEITNENFKLNDEKAEAIVGHDLSQVKDKFDLIFSNILKQPLINLCPEFEKYLNQSGYVITSGFITSQEDDIVKCYESAGFEIANRIQTDEWLSIAFKKK